MNCPKCTTELVKKFYKGMIQIDSCPNCRGMWLDFAELDDLEDIVFEEDAQKGSLIHFAAKTDFSCPQCSSALHEFQYRLYDLRLDYCAEGNHGFWLDAGEDERVMTLMDKRAHDNKRKETAETEWKLTLQGMHSFFRKK